MTTQRKTRPFVPGVIVLEEKHGTYYYDGSTIEKCRAVALSVLRQRDKEGYWYHHPDQLWPNGASGEAPFSEEKLATIAELCEQLGDDSSLRDAKRKNNSWARERREYTDALSWWEDKEQALAENDGNAAWTLLMERADYQYESFRKERFQSVES